MRKLYHAEECPVFAHYIPQKTSNSPPPEQGTSTGYQVNTPSVCQIWITSKGASPKTFHFVYEDFELYSWKCGTKTQKQMNKNRTNPYLFGY